MDAEDIKKYPDPLDPPPWIDANDGRPATIALTIAGGDVQRKLAAKKKELEQEKLLEAQEEAGSNGHAGVDENGSPPGSPWTFAEQIPEYAFHQVGALYVYAYIYIYIYIYTYIHTDMYVSASILVAVRFLFVCMCVS